LGAGQKKPPIEEGEITGEAKPKKWDFGRTKWASIEGYQKSPLPCGEVSVGEENSARN